MTTLGANTTFVSGTNYETVVCGSVCTVSKNTTESYLKSIEVQQTTQNVATADYTVNFATADGNIVKTETRNGVVNSDIALSSADTQAFFDANDATKKYLYVSDDCTGKTVEDNATGTTIVTVTVRPAELWTYTVTTSYNGNALPYRFTGETWEDVPTVKVAYPRFQAAGENENILVEKTPNSNDLLQSITLTSTDYNENFDYTATGIENLYLLSEAENLGTGLSANATSFTSRVSNGLIIFGASGTLVKLPAGNFKFTLGMIGGDSSNHIVNYTVSAGANEILDTQCTGNMLRLATSDVFTLTDSTDITFTCSDPSSSRGIDMIYVEKLAAPTVNINATSNLASYSNQYAVTVPDDVTIYIASAADATDGITLNKVNSKVIPANTGVILYSATTGDKTLTYGGTATSTDFSGNLLLATNDATVASDGTQYVLLKGEQSFAQVVAGVEIPANKAYVTIAGSPAKLAVNMGEATAINAVKTADNAAEDVFNLAGQKVTNSYKGIVIKGGKKYIAR
ncbi:MAG: hypothetical protein I3J02_06560 [Prevotella sp.]|nr:hypothetical protein [Prevotella sp.]